MDPSRRLGEPVLDASAVPWPRSIAGRTTLAAVALAVLLLTGKAQAQIPAAGQNISALSIEELLSIDVTSASKHDEQLFQVPAAVFVITREDLQRSGALSIPEALRMVPGLDVARIDANKWEVSARGFTSRFGNKLLVLIDGRIVYTHLTSGVNWDTQDVVFEDVDRIEVIRGPGATLWGANAVNGVINIITRSSKETQGGLLTAGVGNDENAFGTLQYGGSIGKGLTYRLFAKGFSRDEDVLPDGRSGADGWDSRHAGVRADWEAGPDRTAFQAEIYRLRTGERITEVESLAPPFSVLVDRVTEIRGGFASLVFSHRFSESSSITVSASQDSRSRDEVALRPHEEISDVSLQHDLALGSSQRIIWGVGFRRTTDDIPGSFTVGVTPQRNAQTLLSGFAQDDVTIRDGRLHAILGLKIERYDARSPTYEPNFRLLWTPTPRQTAWASVARALRTPARIDQGIRATVDAFPGNGGPPTAVVLFGNPEIRQEQVVAYEAGYRIQPFDSVSLDLATFYNRYERLIASQPQPPFLETTPAPAHLVIPLVESNGGSADTYGAELAANWNATPVLRFRPALTWLEMHLRTPPGSTQTAGDAYGDGPRFQGSIRTALDLPHHLELDLNIFSVGRDSLEGVPGYTRVDLIGAWKASSTIELSVVFQNLLDRRYLEVLHTTEGIQTTEAARSVYGKVSWRF